MTQSEVWTTLKVLGWTRAFLETRGIENARLEAEWLLCAVTGMDRVGLYLNFEKPLAEQELAAYRSMVARRGKREPLQHILGTQEFCGLEFDVTPDVLIPRHDTEALVNEALSRMPAARSILDIGTGSGCIAIALACKTPDASITAIDISVAALKVARCNAKRHGVSVEFLAGSLFQPVVGRHFDLIVSNPPYIPSSEIEGLEPEVRDYDPRNALDGGPDGLDIYRNMIPAAREFLYKDGWLLVEVGAGQAKVVAELFRNSGGYDEPVVLNDNGSIERVVAARRKE
jgi:release factor glutamine methyltransferase